MCVGVRVCVNTCMCCMCLGNSMWHVDTHWVVRCALSPSPSSILNFERSFSSLKSQITEQPHLWNSDRVFSYLLIAMTF